MTSFDLRRLFDMVDAERTRQGLSWAALSRLVGVSPSTIKRFRDADDAEADGVLALVRWLAVAPETFVDGRAALPLAPLGSGIVRVDMELVAQAQGDTQGARGRTRTSIQRLVAAAFDSDQPIASLTRLSDD